MLPHSTVDKLCRPWALQTDGKRPGWAFGASAAGRIRGATTHMHADSNARCQAVQTVIRFSTDKTGSHEAAAWLSALPQNMLQIHLRARTRIRRLPDSICLGLPTTHAPRAELLLVDIVLLRQWQARRGLGLA